MPAHDERNSILTRQIYKKITIYSVKTKIIAYICGVNEKSAVLNASERV